MSPQDLPDDMATARILKAEELLGRLTQSRPTDIHQVDLGAANVQATLALAEEQRTANLIALLTYTGQMILAGERPGGGTIEAMNRVYNQIEARLGLNTRNTK